MIPGSNVTFDLYPGYSPASPLPQSNVKPLVSGGQGMLVTMMELGRFGYQTQGLYFTNCLLVDPPAAGQDPYASQLTPGPSPLAPGSATVVILDYPIPRKCCAFNVVMIQRVNRGTAADHYRIYLDRALPLDKIANAPDPRYPCIAQGCGACGNGAAPNAWTVTLSGFGNAGVWGSLGAISCLNGSWTLTKNQFSTVPGQTCVWALDQGPPAARMGPLITLIAEVPGGAPTGWYLTVGAFGTISNVLEFSGQWQYHNATTGDCSSPLTFTNPQFQASITDSDSSGARPANITVTPGP
jgi:hypothetical protein